MPKFLTPVAYPKTKTLTVTVELGQVAEILRQLSEEDLDTLDLLLDKKRIVELRKRGSEYEKLKQTGQLLESTELWRRMVR